MLSMGLDPRLEAMVTINGNDCRLVSGKHEPRIKKDYRHLKSGNLRTSIRSSLGRREGRISNGDELRLKPCFLSVSLMEYLIQWLKF